MSGEPFLRCPIPDPRPQLLQEAKRRHSEEEHRFECHANADYQAYHARRRMKVVHRFSHPPDPHQPPATPAGTINFTDPDSPTVKTPRAGCRATTPRRSALRCQIVIAATVTVDSPAFGHLGPMIAAAAHELATAGITDTPAIVLADVSDGTGLIQQLIAR